MLIFPTLTKKEYKCIRKNYNPHNRDVLHLQLQFHRLTTTVTFHSRSRLTSKTIKTALEDCEKFLQTMSDMGTKLDTFEAGANNTSRDTYNDSNDAQ